ncbi:MAG: exosome complex RNA-binding protein Csl4 [Promethearchaeota archaeon]
MKETVKNKDVVITGQFLGVVEEFLPDEQTTFVKAGKIHATKTGTVSINDKRKIEVITHDENNRKTVKIGDIVIGTVAFLRKFSVGMHFYTINQKIHFNSSNFGNIHISQISNKYIEKIIEAFQITDIVRAKVIEQNGTEYKLSTSGRDLGVIHADCSICGTTLDKSKDRFDKLTCSLCGNIEYRKIANDYGNVESNLRF